MKKTLYPKTKRITESKIVITEKLDWSNLWIFNLWWELIIAQRNNVLRLSELNSKNAYKWLVGWIEENKEELKICDWSWVFGEWIWMWKIWYWDTEISNKRFHIFAKANIDKDYEIRNLNYNLDFLQYPFEDQQIPECIWVVPWVIETDNWVSIDYLDDLYDRYKKLVWRRVEWFIINTSWNITKYVRCKNWKETQHTFN